MQLTVRSPLRNNWLVLTCDLTARTDRKVHDRRDAGDEPAALRYQEEFLGKHGPNDYISLVMEAGRGNRNEANRLAGLIDSRPFGYMSLMQAIYWCTCGAPFDLEATPVFSSMLAGSGLPWPPAKPLNFPLKDW